MKILYIFGYKYTLQIWKNSGALEREFEFFNKMWNDHQVRYTLITYGNKNDLKIDLPDNIKIIPMFPNSTKNNAGIRMFIMSFIFPFKIYKNIREFDAIKTNQLNGSWLAIILKVLIKKPLFLRTGFDQLLFAIKDNKIKPKVFFFYLLTKISLNFCDIYSVTSKSDINYLSRKFTNNEKLIYRPNWVKIEKKPTRDAKENFMFLSAGRLESQKNFKLLINALSGTGQDIRIVGRGSEESDLKLLARSLNVNLQIIQNFSYKKFLVSLENVKFFILPSLYEGNPKVLLEAMSKGCVPIVSDIQNHTEIIEDGLNGLTFKNNDVESLRTTLMKAMKMKNYEELSKNSFETVANNNSLEKSTSQEYQDYVNLKKFPKSVNNEKN
jgi:glycosyltransferase involved in cell wall biosynthesis